MAKLGLEMSGGLTGMVDSLYGDMVQISNMVQKSGIEVNEEGTEAASGFYCGGLGCAPSKRKRPPPKDFIADHPFLFMIREDTSRVVFFLGAVVNPLLEGCN